MSKVLLMIFYFLWSLKFISNSLYFPLAPFLLSNRNESFQSLWSYLIKWMDFFWVCIRNKYKKLRIKTNQMCALWFWKKKSNGDNLWWHFKCIFGVYQQLKKDNDSTKYFARFERRYSSTRVIISAINSDSEIEQELLEIPSMLEETCQLVLLPLLAMSASGRPGQISWIIFRANW